MFASSIWDAFLSCVLLLGNEISPSIANHV